MAYIDGRYTSICSLLRNSRAPKLQFTPKVSNVSGNILYFLTCFNQFLTVALTVSYSVSYHRILMSLRAVILFQSSVFFLIPFAGSVRRVGERAHNEATAPSEICSDLQTKFLFSVIGHLGQKFVTSAEEGGYVFGSVCLSVCPSDYSQTCERILTKFLEG